MIQVFVGAGAITEWYTGNKTNTTVQVSNTSIILTQTRKHSVTQNLTECQKNMTTINE